MARGDSRATRARFLLQRRAGPGDVDRAADSREMTDADRRGVGDVILLGVTQCDEELEESLRVEVDGMRSIAERLTDAGSVLRPQSLRLAS